MFLWVFSVNCHVKIISSFFFTYKSRLNLMIGWPVARDSWPVISDPWPVTRGPWPVARGPGPGTRGAWPVARDLRCACTALCQLFWTWVWRLVQVVQPCIKSPASFCANSPARLCTAQHDFAQLCTTLHQKLSFMHCFYSSKNLNNIISFFCEKVVFIFVLVCFLQFFVTILFCVFLLFFYYFSKFYIIIIHLPFLNIHVVQW